MRNTWTIASATYAELTRRPVYYITLAAFAVLIYSSSFLTQFTFFQEVNMVREMGLASVALWGFIIIVSLTGVIVTEELEDRTAVTLLSKPIRRSAFLLGKYAGMLMALFMGMLVLTGVLFYTLWWMAKSDMFGNPAISLLCLVAGGVFFAGGLVGWGVGRARVRRLEAATAVAAPRTVLRLAFASVVAGAVLLLLAAEFRVGSLGSGDVAHYRMLQENPEFRRLREELGGRNHRQVRDLLAQGRRQEARELLGPPAPGAADEARRRIESLAAGTVWEFVGSFMERNGRVVLAGFLLCFLQVAVLCAICVSIAAFAPPVVSVAGTTLAFLLGNLSTYMLGSVERLETGAVSTVGRLFYYLLPNLAYFNLQTHFSEGRLISLRYLCLALLHAGIYSTLAFTVSCSLFERREIR